MASNSNDLATDANSPNKRVFVRERLVHFTWAWFDCTMSTGALASLLGQQPNTFLGVRTIGKVVFIIDIVLFVTLCILVSVRFTLNPRALAKSLHHPLESFYFGAFWVSIALILYCTQQYGVPSCGPWLIKALEVCYWIYASCALLVAVFQYHVIFDEEKLPVFEAMPAWILPAYPFLVLGPLAGVLLYSQPKTSAIPILISGIMFQGLGWTIALIMYTIYFTRLINSDIPEEPKRAGMYIAVGPAGM
jgi:tellurite resistance protein TehA-like permease